MIQHIVLFTPKGGLSTRDVRSFAQSAVAMLERSADLTRYTLGRRVSVGAGYARSFGDKTYEYAAVLEFEDQAALLRYLNSRDHGELGRLFWETCESTVVVEVQVADADAATEDIINQLV